jgi:hypothetical protein
MTGGPWDQRVRLSGQVKGLASRNPPINFLNSAYKQRIKILTASLFANEQDPAAI